MLREIRSVRQVPGETRRRWFTSDTMDLIVWVDEANGTTQIQLCYDKGRRRTERALIWKRGTGYTHTAVDDGEATTGRYKSTPILIADGGFNSARVGALFFQDSAGLPTDIVQFVAAKIQEYQAAIPPLPHPAMTSAAMLPQDKPG